MLCSLIYLGTDEPEQSSSASKGPSQKQARHGANAKMQRYRGDGSGFSINRSMLANDVVSASNCWLQRERVLEIFIRYEYNRSTATAPLCLRGRACEDYGVRPNWLTQPPLARLA